MSIVKRLLPKKVIHSGVGVLFAIDRMMERQPVGAIIACTTQEPMVALTFDDGPHEEYTPRLLDILARHNARATFFIVGEQAQKYPGIMLRIAAEGHTVANHTWNHPEIPDISISEQKRQISTCAAEIAPYRDGTQPIFRPPWGVQDPAFIVRLWRMGYLNVTWNVDADDWNDHDQEWYAEEFHRKARPGNIILLHDRVTPPAEPAALDRSNMLKGLDIALAQLTRSYQFVTVPQLLKHGKPLTRRICSNRLNKLYHSTAP